jgi:hypothetical protein
LTFAELAVIDPTIEFGNNTANRIDPVSASRLGAARFDEVQIYLGGSAGVDNIRYNTIPEPLS